MYIKLTHKELAQVLDSKCFLPCKDYTKLTRLEPILNEVLVGKISDEIEVIPSTSAWPTDLIEVAEVVLARGISERVIYYLQNYLPDYIIDEVGTMPTYIILKITPFSNVA